MYVFRLVSSTNSSIEIQGAIQVKQAGIGSLTLIIKIQVLQPYKSGTEKYRGKTDKLAHASYLVLLLLNLLATEVVEAFS